MKISQRLQLEMSEKRQALNELLGKAERSAEDTVKLGELTTRMQAAEVEYRAAVVSEEAEEAEIRRQFDPSEDRALDTLAARANCGRIFEAALEKRATDGAEKEIQDHYRIGSNQVPLRMIESRAVTPAPTDTGASQDAIVQPVFAGGDAAFLGVDMPRVPSGDAVFPVLTSRPMVGGPHTDSTNVGETTGAFEASVLAPSRLQASFFYRRTDAARFAGMDEALRMALSSGLSEAMDQELVDQVVADVTRTAATAVDTFATYRSRLLYSHIDGRFAMMESDVRMLVGSATLAHMAATYRGTGTDHAALAEIREASGGVRVSALIAAVAANKQDAIIRRGNRRDAVAPIWEGIILVPDEVTKASTGEIVITAIMLASWKIIRAGGFSRVEAQHA